MINEEGHVLTHLGMGDQITCNGLVRELYKRHSKLYVYCKLKYFYSIEFMYRDLPNIRVLPMEEKGAHDFVQHYNIKNFYNIGFRPTHEMLMGCKTEITVEKSFYQQANVNFDKKWESFYVERDSVREDALFKELIPNQYIFFHDDIPRQQIIDHNRVKDKSLPIYRASPNITNNIFDYCKIIENAKEIHVIESCMMFLIDLVFQKSFENKDIFIHRYTKPINPFEYPTNKLGWWTLR